MRRKSTVYVGIVVFNSAKYLNACFDALLHSNYAPLSIIVFDNNSTDDAEKIVSVYGKKIKYIKNFENKGFGRAHNEIINTAQIEANDYYLALNPDALIAPDYISYLVDACKKNNANWATGKLYKSIKHKILYSVGHALLRDGYAFNIGYDTRDEGQYDESREVFGAPGAAALYTGKFIYTMRVNGHFFDPDLFMYYEDVDVDWRGRLAGMRCWYESKAVAEHQGATLSPALVAHALANRFLSIIKNAHINDLIFYNLPVIFFHIVLRLLFTPFIGVLILKRFVKGILHALKSRSTGSVNTWFIWSKKQDSGQPRTILARLRSFAAYE